jgi:hypothetical protein
MNSDLFLSNAGFLERFADLHKNRPEHPFCWVLGTGASASSGIPMGRELTERWLNEMYERSSSRKPSLEEWANNQFSDIPGFTFKQATNFYPYIFQSRYGNNPEEGISFLEGVLDQATPGFGYKVLAQIMASTKHKVAVTTNFDNLISDSMILYTEKVPLVCGYELLTDSLIAALRRPLVAKIHREFLLAPQNDPDEIIHLAEDWKKPLTELFANYTRAVLNHPDGRCQTET